MFGKQLDVIAPAAEWRNLYLDGIDPVKEVFPE